MRILIVLLIAVIGIGGNSSCVRSDKIAKQTYKQSKIVFESLRHGKPEIYTMNPDGSNQTRLTNNPDYDDVDASWSPNGIEITFASDADAVDKNGRNLEICVMNSDGTNKRRLTSHHSGDAYSFFSPDGRKIVFSTSRDGNAEIYIMDVDGSNQKNLTNNPATDGIPSWSPDGGKITFQSGRDGNMEIYAMDADGGNQKNLTNKAGQDGHAHWSPDGSKIVFDSLRDRNFDVYVVNADGSGQRRLTNNPAIDWMPCWSPDAKKIAFVSNRGEDPEVYEIYVMNTDGSGQRKLTNDHSANLMPHWSPWIAESPTVKEILLNKQESDNLAEKDKYLAGQWIFNKGAGDTVTDSSGNGNDGKIHGAKWVKTDKGYALEFDGIDDYVDCGNDASLNITDLITIEAWIYPYGLGNKLGNIARKGGNGLIGYNFNMGPFANTAEFWFFSNRKERLATGKKVAYNKWHHVAGVYDGSHLIFYLDGIKFIGSEFTGSISDCTTNLYIGGDPGHVPRYFNGAISEVRIYNRALTAKEIKSHYKQDSEARQNDKRDCHGTLSLAMTKKLLPKAA